jgi:hypothetical protein
VGSAGAAANSVLLDGVDDYVIIAGDPAALKLTGPMTVEAWFKHPAVSVAVPAVIASKAGPGGPSWVMDLSSADGNIEFLAFGDNGANMSGAASAQSLNDGVWHHAAGVWDGVEPRLYIDGVLAAVGPTSSSPLFDTTDAVVIGNDAALDPTPLFTGEIDEVRIWDIARSDAEIAATTNTTLVGNESNLVGYWNFDSGTADDLAGASHGTLGGGASLVTSEAPLSGGAESEQALTLDGVDDFVDVGNTASLQITGAITVESWFRTSRDYAALTPFNVLAGKWYAGGTRAAYALAISDSAHLAGAEGLSFIIYNDSFNHLAAASNLDYNDGQWHHAAGTWDGSTISLYVDGALVGSDTDGAFGAISDISDQFRIGTDAWSDSTRWFEGDLDDVRVWNVARTQAEVQAGITAWVDPTSAGLQGCWTFNSGDGADSTTNANDGTLTNGAAAFATPVMDASVTEIAFGSQDVGVESASQSFTITNSGDSVVNVTAVASGDPTRFGVTAPATLPFSVAVGATSGQFDVTFTPDAVGSFDSGVLLTHDARALTSIALSGTGQAAAGANVVSLDGSSSLVDTSVSLPTELQGAYTAAAWVKLNGMPGSTATVVGSQEGSVHLSVDYMGYVRAGFWNAGVEEVAASGAMLVSGKWHYVAGTHDGATLTVYIDGVADGTYTPMAGTAVNSNPTPLQIGGLDDTSYSGSFSGNYLNGQVDEVRVWDVALTQADIQSEMNTDTVGVGVGTSLLGHWNFDGGTATDEVSTTVGTLTGAASILSVPTSTLSANSVDFGSVDSGTTTAAQNVTLTNSGSLDVTVNAFSSTDPTHFTATSGDAFPLTLTAGQSSGPIAVTFSPDAIGAFAGVLDITHDARGVGAVQLTGSGQAAAGANVASFDGSNDLIDTATVYSTELASDWTLGAWVKLNSFPGSEGHVLGSSKGARLAVDNYGAARVSFTGAAYDQTAQSGTFISSGQWHHIAGSYDTTTSKLTVYVDGVTDGTYTPTYSDVSPSVGRHRRHLVWRIHDRELLPRTDRRSSSVGRGAE